MDSGFSIGGRAQLVLGSGCIWESNWNVSWKWGAIQIYDCGQLRLENGGTYNQYHNAGKTGLYSWEQDWPALVVGNGGVFQMGGTAGNGATVYRIEDGGTVKLCYRYGFENNYKTSLFEGAKAVEIPEGATATISGCVNSYREHDKYLTNSVPFVGGGNLVITNTYKAANPKDFFFYQNAPCSITGSLKVADDCQAKFIFNGPAEWGGTVHTKNVEQERLPDTVVANTFGGLCLETDWPLVVKADGRSDTIVIGNEGFTGNGKITLQLEPGVKVQTPFTIGSAPMTLENFPKVSGYRVFLEPLEDNPERAKMNISKRGFNVIFR